MDPEAVAGAGRVPHGSSDDPDLLDFSANTNPLVPDGVEDVYREAFDAARTYPPDDYPDYRAAAAAYVDCEAEDVVATPGGLAAIRLAVEVTVDRGNSVLVPYPSFGEYAREVRLQGARVESVPHDGLLAVDRAALADHALAVVCNPNNPTGDAYDASELSAFADRCREAGTPLLVDEAFLGFTDEPSLAGREGVVVARSLTKLFGLPGIRAGFAVAAGDLGTRLEVARRAWALGTPAAAVGAHCMRCDGFVAETRERVRTERDRMCEALAERFGVFPSDSPFVLLDVGERDVASLVERARERGIAVRDATTFRGLASHVRVAVRLPGENDRLLEVLADV
jgi:L-threonine-O-3-phosphate decarboxylase